MKSNNNTNYVYLVWKSPISHTRYIIGILSKNNNYYEFKYNDENTINIAKNDGFVPLTCFQDLNTIYKNNILFPIFSSRLPDKRRKDITNILKKYDLEEYDEYKLLKRSGARLPIDTLEIIDPMFDNQTSFTRIFFLAGIRHYIGCNGNDCHKSFEITRGDSLILQKEPKNEYDKYAIKVLNSQKDLLGYIPRYYSEQLTNLINNGASIKCNIRNVNKCNYCDECIQIILTVN